MIYTYHGVLLSHKKEWNNSSCSNIDEPSECHIEWCKSDRGGEIWHPYMWNLKMKWYKWAYKTERDSKTKRMNLQFSGAGFALAGESRARS